METDEELSELEVDARAAACAAEEAKRALKEARRKARQAEKEKNGQAKSFDGHSLDEKQLKYFESVFAELDVTTSASTRGSEPTSALAVLRLRPAPTSL